MLSPSESGPRNDRSKRAAGRSSGFTFRVLLSFSLDDDELACGPIEPTHCPARLLDTWASGLQPSPWLSVVGSWEVLVRPEKYS